MTTSQATPIDSQATACRSTAVIARMENLPRPEILAFFATVIVIFLYRQLSQPEGGDSAIWDYVAQCILRGQIPYRDVVEIKTPGSAYLSASAMWIGTRLGLRDVMAARLMQILLVGLLSATTYMVTLCYLRSRAAALIAFMIPLMSAYFVGWMVEGTQPKLSMTLFGMLTILLIAKDRPFWAGVCSMLSCLCWQPGLLFTGTAVLIFSRYFTSWRDLRALKVMTGAALPLVIVVLYFYSAGALKDFWTWTVAYNYHVYGPKGAKPLSDQSVHIGRVIWRVMGVKVILFVLGLAGLLMFTVERAAAKLKGRKELQSHDLFKDALLIAPAVYLIFCLVDFQAGPDLIPLFPFIGVFGGWFVVKTGRSIKRRSQGINQNALFNRMTAVAREVVIAIAFVITVVCAASHKAQGVTLHDQYGTYTTLSDMLASGDKIYAAGAVEVLVLLKRPNLNPYIMWDKGKDTYVAAEKYGGSFKAIIDEIESQRPRLVALSRIKGISGRAELERWVAEHYDQLEGYNDSVYLRRPGTASTFSLFPRILERKQPYLRLTACSVGAAAYRVRKDYLVKLNQVRVPSTDVAQSVEFYKKLGLIPIVLSLPKYARFVCPDGDATFSVHHHEQPGTGEKPVVYFECENLDGAVEEFKRKGVVFDSEPRDQPWLWREAYLRDPDGNVICLYFAGNNRLNPPWKLNSEA